MRLFSFFLVFIVLCQNYLISQNVEFKKSNFKDNPDEFKIVEEGLKQADEFFELGSNAIFEVKDPGLNFQKALINYMRAQDLNPNNGLNNFKIGVCHVYSSTQYEAIKFIKKAIELDPACDPFIDYYHGYILQLELNFDEALIAYDKFENNYRKADNFSKFVGLRKQECKNAKKAVSDPERVWVDNVSSLNTEFDEIAPSITTDGSQIIFSSNRPNDHTPNEVNAYDHEIFTAFFNEGVWQKANPVFGAVNTNIDDIVNNLSYDGTKMLIHRMNENQIDIYESQLNGAKWGAADIMPRQISSPQANEMYASYNHDGYNIFFSRDSDTRSNGFDVVYSGMQSKLEKNYGAATMVSEVNTKFNDGPIYLAIDGRTMYMASQGHESLGGYDIFVSYKDQGSWTRPKNMGYPINTPYDDLFFAVNASGKFAYIASNRSNGKGGFDIYKVTFWGPPKEPIVDVEDYLLASLAFPIKDPQIEKTVSVNKVSLTVFKGITIDALTRKSVEAEIEIVDNSNGKLIEKFTSNSATGKFLLSLPAGKNYGIAVKAEGYLFHSENFDIPEGSDYNLVDKTIELKNIAVGSKIALRNIFFDIGKSVLRPESNAELDRLVKLLIDVPKLNIEISGHTDNTGSSSVNDKLSQDRAEAVVSYLKAKGISSARMTAKGYGSSKPIASNSTSDGRQENRRTEFEIKSN